MKALSIDAGMLITLLVVQIGWHALLDLEHPVTNALRAVYLHEAYNKPTAAPVVDILIPAVLAGFVFSRLRSKSPKWEAGVFAVAAGLMLSLAQFAYVHAIDYTLWWLPAEAGDDPLTVLLYAAFGAGFCWVAALQHRRSRDREMLATKSFES